MFTPHILSWLNLPQLPQHQHHLGKYQNSSFFYGNFNANLCPLSNIECFSNKHLLLFIAQNWEHRKNECRTGGEMMSNILQGDRSQIYSNLSFMNDSSSKVSCKLSFFSTSTFDYRRCGKKVLTLTPSGMYHRSGVGLFVRPVLWGGPSQLSYIFICLLGGAGLAQPGAAQSLRHHMCWASQTTSHLQPRHETLTWHPLLQVIHYTLIHLYTIHLYTTPPTYISISQ